MKRVLTILAVLTLAALGTPVVGGGAAEAAPATCRGERATIVGKPGQFALRGTARRDVIVSNGVDQVHAGDGSDLICVRGGPEDVYVWAGPGDDDVWIANGMAVVHAELGSGADAYHGSPGNVRDVVSDALPSEGRTDTDRDVIRTGGGFDSVDAGAPGRLMGDRIDLGAGRGQLGLWGRGMTGGNVLRAGAGSTLSVIGENPGHWRIDNRSRVISQDGLRRFAYTGFDHFSLDGETVDFYGTARSESLITSGAGRVSLGDGDDRLSYSPSGPGRLVARGGGGVDELSVFGRNQPTALDAGAGRGSIGDVPLDVAWFERWKAYSYATTTITGSDRPETLVAGACTQSDDATLAIDGGGGNDRISAPWDPGYFDDLDCHVPGTTLRGGPGADRIQAGIGDILVDGGTGADLVTAGPRVDALEVLGGPGNDRLFGQSLADHGEIDVLRGGSGDDYLDGENGPDRLFGDEGDDQLHGDRGDDTADGGADADLCRAETVVRCERG